jgi:hypothetical protein
MTSMPVAILRLTLFCGAAAALIVAFGPVGIAIVLLVLILLAVA